MEKITNYFHHNKGTASFLLIMILYFIALTLFGGSTSSIVLLTLGALYPPLVVESFQVYRIVTAIFMHIGIAHLYFNGYALYIFGPQIEKLMGTKKFIAFFLLSGIGGNLATIIFNYNSLSAGASGSLFGLFGGFLYLMHRHKELVTPYGKKSITRLLLINLAITFIIPGISTTAHLGGLLFGYLLSYIFIK